MLFTRAGLEQATGQVVARHRARRFADAGGHIVDLCCGIGGDLIALGALSGSVVGVDRDEVHCLLARHNAAVYDVDARLAVADVSEVRVPARSSVFVDPARRSGDRRGGSSPSLDWCLGLPADRVCTKAAPGLDLAVVPQGWEAEFVAVGRDLKEAALWSPAWATGGRRATVLSATAPDDPAGTASLVADPATPSAEVRPPGRYLVDPSPAVTRAGAVADLAADLGAWQVDRRIAFLSCDQPVSTPFGRCLRIEASLPFGVKALAAQVHQLDIGAIDLRRRGLAGDVDELRRRLRPRGSRRATVVLTRVVNKPWAFICSDVAEP